MELYSLYDILQKLPEKEEKLLELFKKFKSKNKECNRFLLKQAIGFEKNHLCRTYFALNEDSGDIDFFFSIALSYIDKDSISKGTLNEIQTPPKEKTHIPTFLLAQIAKNENCKVEGREIMKEALRVIYSTQRKVSGFCIKLDAINVKKVIDFYKSFDFRIIDENKNKKNECLTMMHIISPILSKEEKDQILEKTKIL